MKKVQIENNEKLDQLRKLLFGAFKKQQIETIIEMLAKLSEALSNIQVGDSVTIKASVRQRKRLTIEITDAPEQKTHFHKIVLGACRKAHLECLRSNKEFNFKKIEQKLYTILFTNNLERVEKVRKMKKLAHWIYRSYYSKIQKSRNANSSSPILAELQQEFPEADTQTMIELISVWLEDKQFRISGDNMEFIRDLLWIANGKIPNKERAK
ncbi:MAG: hypothetical protein LBT81_00600 [Helicobacteraceae bacterium]|jgi:hypothetical protein|nr:hypothetical protein [Helicobacteraceae bacterium]